MQSRLQCFALFLLCPRYYDLFLSFFTMISFKSSISFLFKLFAFFFNVQVRGGSPLLVEYSGRVVVECKQFGCYISLSGHSARDGPWRLATGWSIGRYASVEYVQM